MRAEFVGGGVDGEDGRGIGLADAIGQLRDELLQARAAGSGEEIQLPVESMTVELKVVATRRADGKAGFKVPVVDLELGGSGSWQREAVQTITVTFSQPVDQDGRPAKVAQATDELMG